MSRSPNGNLLALRRRADRTSIARPPKPSRAASRTVDNVYNEIFVGAPSSFVRSAQDELITAQIRARLTASPRVRAININIETFHGNVYLMGIARSEQELQRAAEIASVVGGVRRVVSFMQVRAPQRAVLRASRGAAGARISRRRSSGQRAGAQRRVRTETFARPRIPWRLRAAWG